MKRESWLPAAPEGVPRARAIVRELASDLRLDRTTTWELMLATTEAFANAVEHGHACEPRGIFLRAEAGDGQVGVEISDCGGCFPTARRSSKRHGEGGRGMPIIAAIMDQLEVVPDTGRTRVRFAKRLTVV
jgi:anti-sigma regulatory factor (Ser/Thr protein kinase)